MAARPSSSAPADRVTSEELSPRLSDRGPRAAGGRLILSGGQPEMAQVPVTDGVHPARGAGGTGGDGRPKPRPPPSPTVGPLAARRQSGARALGRRRPIGGRVGPGSRARNAWVAYGRG